MVQDHKKMNSKFIQNKLAELIIKGEIHKHEEYTIKFDPASNSIKI